MTDDALTAISPLDGRYRGALDALADTVSELALMRYRVKIELRWFEHLANASAISELPPLSPASTSHLRNIERGFGTREGERVKELERTTNHDVKAVEYFVKENVARDPALRRYVEFVHFACTSEDINNLAYSSMLADARKNLLVPAMMQLEQSIADRARQYADVAMLARTHGQAASPTTMGKELANVAHRARRQRRQLEAVHLLGKMNGAVGNYNAHVAAYPTVDWPALSRAFVESLGIVNNPYTTQIEPHDCIAEYCHALMRFNQVLLDFDRDVWGYIAIDYFRSRKVEGETGSSTMPHKVNPIDFENSEGNVGIANAILGHLAEKLPVSRWQRDLSDSTVLRNVGVGIGHTLVAVESALKGIGKLELNEAVLEQDLNGSYEVLAEAVQTLMRKHGVAEPYERLKRLTRGRRLDARSYAALLEKLELPAEERAALARLTPAGYIGLAAPLARDIDGQ
jgi:adenylosuccinate lyase